MENFQIYIENTQFFQEIEYSFKYFSSVYDLDEESLIVTIEAGNVSSWKKYLGVKGISLGI